MILKICAALPDCFRHISIDDDMRNVILATLSIASMFRKLHDLASSEKSCIRYGKREETYEHAFYRIFVAESLPDILATLNISVRPPFY